MKKFYLLLILHACLYTCASAQMTLVKPIRLYSYMYHVGNQILFFGNNDADPYSPNFELWASDGTDAGTHLVKDIVPGSQSGIPLTWENGGGTYRPIVYNDRLYFVSGTTSSQGTLWSSDGTDAGTSVVHASPYFDGNYHYPNFCIFNNVLYFAAFHSNGLNNELWRTDGTSAGTYIVKEIAPNSNGFGSEPSYMIVYNGAMYFSAYTEEAGNELWKTDGTAAGTVMVKDFYTGYHGIMDNNNGGKLLPWLTVSGNYLYFIGNTDTLSYVPRLFRTDGTAAGTIQLHPDLMPQDLVDVNGTLFFYAYDVQTGGRGLYKSDGTAAGTVAVPVNNNIQPFPGDYDYRQTLFSFKNKLYFPGAQVVDFNNSHIGMYQSDGTATGTFLVNEMPLYGDGHYNTDYVQDASGSSFMWRSLLGGSVNGDRIVQMDGAPGNYKVYYGAEVNPGGVLVNGDLYVAGHDTTVSVGGYGLYKIHPALTSAPLPVTWLSFDAVTNASGGVDLQWTTGMESNNKGFEVERSADGMSFVALHSVAPGDGHYAWTDVHPLDGDGYYRIRQTDYDGKMSYSAVKKITIAAKAIVAIMPNPVSGGTLTIRHSLAGGKVWIKITDMAGRTVAAQERVISGNLLSIDVASLGAGVYHLEMSGAQGRLASSIFVKNP